MSQSGRKHGRRTLYGVLGLLVLALTMGAELKAQSVLTRHVRQELRNGTAPFLNRVPDSQTLKLTIALPLRNESELDELLQQLYDPQSPLFHRFLSVQEFTDRFGPSEEDYAKLVQFAQRNGLTVTGTSTNRLTLNVSASVANINRAFHVTMGSYQHPTEQRTFYSPDREPSIDLAISIWHISGLDNFSIPRPASLHRVPESIGRTTGSGPGGQFLGSDMRIAYYGTGSLDGSGQSVGLVEFAGYNIDDVNTYFATFGPPLTTSVIGVSTDGSSLNCSNGCDDTEQVLDIEEAIAMAPRMHSVLVYVSDTSDVSIFSRMAQDNIAKSLSCSWGWSPADPASDDPIFKEFAAQGQTLFVASGDSGAYRRNSKYVYPADDAYVTSVGGTDLVTSGPGGPWQSESAWSSSGGGISPNHIAIPSWQKPAINSSNKGSTIYRNAPDVAAAANTDNYICYNGTCAGGWGGTSFAAPRWAGYLALVNQQSGSGAGFINPTIYSIGLGSSYSTDFHDIKSGSNGTYSTVRGYDLVTGWGSPNGSALIDALAQ